MSEEPERPKKAWPWIGLPLFILAFALFDHFMKGRPATASATAFVTAAREGRGPDVYAHSTADLARRLQATPREATLTRMYELVRTSQKIDGGYTGEWTHGCINGQIGNERVWFLLVKERGNWLVADLRPDPRPSECNFDE